MLIPPGHCLRRGSRRSRRDVTVSRPCTCFGPEGGLQADRLLTMPVGYDLKHHYNGAGRTAPQPGSRPNMQIIVRDNNVDQALRALKKKLQREGVYREMKLRRHYEKPSEKRAREHAAAISRARKAERKRLERVG